MPTGNYFVTDHKVFIRDAEGQGLGKEASQNVELFTNKIMSLFSGETHVHKHKVVYTSALEHYSHDNVAHRSKYLLGFHNENGRWYRGLVVWISGLRLKGCVSSVPAVL